MIKKIFFACSIITTILCFNLPIQAGHLDGLWRNNRMQITLRIEEDHNGFKAKRTDQGIWYHYTTHDNIHFTDRNGNWYELVDQDELVWHEANRAKQVYFVKVDSRNNDRWDYDRNDDYNRRNNTRSWDSRNLIEGNWYELNGRDDLRVKSFDNGIKVKSDHGGWDKFFPDRTSNRFRDNNGNTIIIVDRETLRYRGQYGRQEKMYIRHPQRKHGHKNWKN